MAVSLLRLSHADWKGIPPATGGREPHPMQKPIWQNQGVKLEGPKVIVGGGTTLPWYEIDSGEATVATPEFQAKAAAIFAPTKATLPRTSHKVSVG
ncbi:hypothetical protein FHS85_000777 [Rhodoligotrophos appendicifer]|uniref:hypothetical protein n=1 Tax=Rhodoligotrophos appendicifer TaxID=987056 RepID=UPI001186751E|nr:hypothetical protein [Rhodoligotrophos appendicifer]